jgi:hypothetical protein
MDIIQIKPSKYELDGMSQICGNRETKKLCDIIIDEESLPVVSVCVL